MLHSSADKHNVLDFKSLPFPELHFELLIFSAHFHEQQNQNKQNVNTWLTVELRFFKGGCQYC